MGLHLPSWPARLLVRGSWVTGRSGRKLGQARWLQCRSPSQPQGPQHQSGREPALHRPQGPSEWRARGQRHSQREALGGQRGQDIPCGPVCPGGGGQLWPPGVLCWGPGPPPPSPLGVSLRAQPYVPSSRGKACLLPAHPPAFLSGSLCGVRGRTSCRCGLLTTSSAERKQWGGAALPPGAAHSETSPDPGSRAGAQR